MTDETQLLDLTPPEDERALLDGFVDWFRTLAAARLDGLNRAEATRVATPTGLTLAGIVKHLAWVERVWFRYYLEGEDLDLSDNPGSFALGPEDTVESVVADYRSACDDSRRIAAESSSLDRRAVRAHALFGQVSLRWILVHMIDETAGHKGHQDILRELTDGVTG